MSSASASTSIHFFSSLSLGAKKKTKGLTHLQTNSHLHHLFILFILIFHKRFLDTDILFFFTTEHASLFFHKAFSKDDRPFTSSTAVTRDLRANPYLHPFPLSSLLSRSPGNSWCFFYDFLALHHDKFTVYLFAVSFFYCHTLLVTFSFLFCSWSSALRRTTSNFLFFLIFFFLFHLNSNSLL